MIVYADTSFFVSLYLPDAHSRAARSRLGNDVQIFLTPLHRAEWAHAVAQHVFRRVITPSEAHRVLQRFEEHRSSALWIESALPEAALETCALLARDWVPRLGTRTLDTLHVASALELACEFFWTFDTRQAKLAAAVGLKQSRAPQTGTPAVKRKPRKKPS